MPSRTHDRAPAIVYFIPNVITVARILLLPLFAWLVLRCRDGDLDEGVLTGMRLQAAGVLFLIGLGDVVDGALARRFGAVTAIGRFLDPLADKLAQATGLVLFTFFAEPAFQPLPVGLLVLILVRDVVLGLGALLLLRRGVLEIRPGRWGRAATFSTFALLLTVASGLLDPLQSALELVSGVCITASSVIYFRRGWDQWLRAA